MPEGHRARKRFSQNFLHDQHYIARIVAAVNAQPGERIVDPKLAPLLAGRDATDVAALDRIYAEIDQLAGASPVKVVERTASVPIAPWLLSASLLLLLAGMALRASRWGVIP